MDYSKVIADLHALRAEVTARARAHIQEVKTATRENDETAARTRATIARSMAVLKRIDGKLGAKFRGDIKLG